MSGSYENDDGTHIVDSTYVDTVTDPDDETAVEDALSAAYEQALTEKQS